MANCENCEATIFYGGRQVGDYRFCSEKCYQKGYVEPGLAVVPQELFEAELKKVHNGPCPMCGGTGPVDVHMAHKVWSAIYLSSQTAQPFVCCRACARKKQLMGSVFSFVAGWWSITGFFLTPLKILENIGGMLFPPNPREPSSRLKKLVRASLAARQVAVSSGASASSPKPINSAQPEAKAASVSPFSDIGKPIQ